MQGHYALNLRGADFTTNPGQEDVAGLLLPNGGSAITGTLDINDSGNLGRGATVQLASYQVAASGRGTATLQTDSSLLKTATWSLYVIDASNVLFLETDSSRMLVGSMQKQY